MGTATIQAPARITVDETAVKKAMETIQKGYPNRHLKFKVVAEQAGYSYYYFHRMFKEHFGITPKTALDRCRLGDAQVRLLRGESCGEIAQALGFVHASHFSARFKQLTGVRPSEWVAKERKRECEAMEDINRAETELVGGQA